MMSYNPHFQSPHLSPAPSPTASIYYTSWWGEGLVLPSGAQIPSLNWDGSVEKRQDRPLISSFWGSSVVKT